MEVRFATTSYLLVIHHRHQPNWEICYVQGAPGLAIYAIILLDTYIIYIYINISFMWVVSVANIFLWAQGIYCQLEVDQALLGSSPPSKPQLGALAFACRMILALILIMSRGGVWLLEQPVSSLVFRHPRFRELLRRTTAS